MYKFWTSSPLILSIQRQEDEIGLPSWSSGPYGRIYHYGESSWKEPGQCSPLSLVEECRGLALIGRKVHSVAPPALICHKEPARRIQSLLLGALDRKIPSSLVLYGIRDSWLPCTERSYNRRPYAIKNQRRARNMHGTTNESQALTIPTNESTPLWYSTISPNKLFWNPNVISRNACSPILRPNLYIWCL